MKHYLSISLMLLATLTLIVFAVFPHHHHEGMTCLILEVCDSHDPINEEHTNHHHPDDQAPHHHNCISESDVEVVTTKENVHCKVCLCNNCDHRHHFPFLYLIAGYLIYEQLSVDKPEYGEFIVSYKPVDASHTHGLRAPPFFTV